MHDYEEINLYTPKVKPPKRRMCDRHPVLTLFLALIPFLACWATVVVDMRAGDYAHLSYSQLVTFLLPAVAISALTALWAYRRI